MKLIGEQSIIKYLKGSMSLFDPLAFIPGAFSLEPISGSNSM
jgi:hypothetical protein